MSKEERSYQLDKVQAQALCNALRLEYRVFGPVLRRDGSRFSGQDLAVYDEVCSFEDLDLSAQTFFSPKELLFPVRETLFTVEQDGVKEAPFEEKPALIFLRACDIHAVEVMDLHFLAGAHPDTYYQRRREMMRIVLLECPTPFDTCHCLSLGTDKSASHHAFMRRSPDGYEWVVWDASLFPFFSIKEESVSGPCPVPYNKEVTPIPEKVDKVLFEDEMWKEYSRRCIACGRCNTSCPTCTCFSIWDVKTEKGTERQRIWSACHVKKFALLAGNHDFRVKNGERMRYKVLHKIQDFRARTGKQMCTGCGRCDLVCPEYISMFRSIQKLNEVVARQKKEPHGS